MSSADVLIAGSRVRSERTDGETRPVVATLAAHGVTAEVHPWDADVDWGAAALVAVRTTWDYSGRLDEFLAWARDVHAATRLRNPLAVLEWNTHKRYLLDLADAGVPIVPTTLLPRGAADDQRAATLDRPGAVVVKPAVSAGGRDTFRGEAATLAGTLADLVDVGDVLVQDAVASIGRDGEVSLVRLGDVWSHAVRKRPAAGEFLVHERYGGRLDDHTPTASELAVAEAALASVPGDPDAVYAARVDLVRIDGEPVVMELELVEPELFVRRATGAADRLANALVACLDRR